ncbi:MAG: hypothetical protein HY077_16435 [Elusimicrobia bacterium]|nr:hypothetical protein [Elusimicrobiota bacterium]
MSRLSEIARCPAAHKRSVGPHQFRRIGDYVLAVDDAGRFVFLSPSEYRDFLKGLKPDSPLREKLGHAGLLRDAFDFDDAAQCSAERGLLAWPGTSVHVIRLEKYGSRDVMDLGTARKVVDFVFTVPGPCVNLRLCAELTKQTWGLVWFIVQYARRKGEWHKRPVAFTWMGQSAPSVEQAEFLAAHKVDLRTEMWLSGKPKKGLVPMGVRRATALVQAPANQAAAWVDCLAEAGVESVLLATPPSDTGAFLEFYAAAIDRMLQLQGRLEIREERALGLLSGRRWLLPGHDLLSELCYAPDGGIYSSELALVMAGDGKDLLKLGQVGSTRYEDLAKSPAVRAVLAASLSENQPMCSQCAYRAFCAIPPSESLAAQGTLWGRHPSSERCSLHMAILDILFARLARTESAEALRAWMS